MNDDRHLDFSVELVYVGPRERIAQVQSEIARWRRAASEGEAKSQYHLARAYLDIWEEFKKRDESQALIAAKIHQTISASWREALERYQPFYDAFDVDDIQEQVLHWYRAAAQQGLLEAQYELGTFLLMDMPAEESFKTEGQTWLEMAGTAGHAEAAYDLHLYLSSNNPTLKQDTVMSAIWLERAALLGHTEGAHYLAMSAYGENERAPKDPVKAYIWTSVLRATQPADSWYRGWPFDMKSYLSPDELHAADEQVAAILASKTFGSQQQPAD